MAFAGRGSGYAPRGRSSNNQGGISRMTAMAIGVLIGLVLGWVLLVRCSCMDGAEGFWLPPCHAASHSAACHRLEIRTNIARIAHLAALGRRFARAGDDRCHDERIWQEALRHAGR